MRHWAVDPRRPDAAVVREIADRLAAGDVLVFPTETFYGLAADVRHAQAVARVCRLKGRASDKPILLLVDSVDRARQLAPGAPEELEALAKRFWPGPLTLVVPAPRWLPAEITAGTGTLAVRHCAHPIAQLVIAELGGAVTGTSANRGGAPPTREAAEVSLADGRNADGTVDAGATPGGQPSTLVDLTARPFPILREGATSKHDLRRALGALLL